MKKTDFIEGGIQKITGILVSKNAPSWEKFRFISGAKSKDSSRFMMSGIHIEQAGNKTLLISTDGRRLHIAILDTLDIEPGDYVVKEKNRDFMVLHPMAEEIQYPNWRRIIQSLETQKSIQINLNNKNKHTFSVALYGLYKSTDAAINFEYLEPLANAAPTWDVYFYDKNKSHVFTSGDLMAVIMPIGEVDEIEVNQTAKGPDFKDITPAPNVIEFKPPKKSKVKKTA